MLTVKAHAPKRARRKPAQFFPRSARGYALLFLVVFAGGVGVVAFQARYTVTVQPPVRVRFQSPMLIAPRKSRADTAEAQADQLGHRLTAYQQYACNKFGVACRVALAVQRAENPRGACEIYHYNSDGTLDWGYFQINTVHLKRPGLNLRDLLDCKANIDFAYQLYTERGFDAWTAYTSGAYMEYLRTF